MPHYNDIRVDRLLRSWSEVTASTTNAAATATHAAVAGMRHVVTRIDAGYDTVSAGTRLLTVSFGSTVVWRGFINRVKAIDMELLNTTANQAVSATLASGNGAAIVGNVTIMGYTVDDDA